MALASITANTGATIEGRLLARTGAVTLDSNVISRPTSCSAAEEDDDTTIPVTPVTPSESPESPESPVVPGTDVPDVPATPGASDTAGPTLAETGTSPDVGLLLGLVLTAAGVVVVARRRVARAVGSIGAA